MLTATLTSILRQDCEGVLVYDLFVHISHNSRLPRLVLSSKCPPTFPLMITYVTQPRSPESMSTACTNLRGDVVGVGGCMVAVWATDQERGGAVGRKRWEGSG